MSTTPFKDMEEILGNDAEAAEFNFKKKAIEQENIRSKYDRLQEKKAELAVIESFDLENEDPSVIQKIADEGEDYLLKAKNAKVFLNDDFKGKIPLFPRNIIFAAAETGVGKSTICANLALRAIIQNQRVLILTNEENPSDVYNRIICLLRGWAYVDHTSFTAEQIKIFKEMTILLSERVTIVGDKRGGLDNLTTTIEGIKQVLNSVLSKDSKFELIVIDYYQNIDRSTEDQNMSAWDCQYRFCKFIDQYKNHSNASIVILGQLKSSGDKTLSFKDAIEGRKTIMNVASCVLRVTKEPDKRRTGFEVMKSRFNESLGQTIYVGFDRGKYVDYTKEFEHKATMEALEKSMRSLDPSIKPKNFNDKD
jgi:predicted ATP-dependent serine protease